MPVNTHWWRGSGWHEPKNKERAYTNVKLTPEQVREIRQLLAQRKPVKEIAATYGVSIGSIYDIKLGRTWGDVK